MLFDIWSMLMTVVTFLVVGGLVMTLNHMFHDRNLLANLAEGCGIGLICGAVRWFAVAYRASMVAEICFSIAMILAIGYLVYRWTVKGDRIREIVVAILLLTCYCFLFGIAFGVIADAVPVPLLAGLLAWLPIAMLVAISGYFVYTLLDYRAGMALIEREDESMEKKLSTAGLATLVVAVFMAAMVMGCGAVARQGAPETAQTDAGTTEIAQEPTEVAELTETAENTAVTEATQEAMAVQDGTLVAANSDTVVATTAAAAMPEWNWVHDGVLANDNTEDDYDFGLDPLGEVLAKRVANGELSVDDLANKSEKQLYKLLVGEAEDVVDIIENDAQGDPSLTAAMAAWYDVNMHTRLIGDFMVNYKGHEEDWMRMNNYASEFWDEHPAVFDDAVANFIDHLRHADEVVVEYQTGLTDQMYMDGLTAGTRPDVIVLESANNEGYFITFKYNVKSETINVSYRMNCRWQPTNVAKKLGVTPGKNPNKRTSTVGGSGGGGKGGSGGGKKNQFSNPKDPTKGTKVLPNDTNGPGPDTNNGVGAQYSRVDQPTNSNHMTQEQYWQKMEDLTEINETQREGGDSNTPSTAPPSTDTRIDNNADTGGNNGGNGGIDKPTPTSNDATPVDGSSITSSGGDGAWGGPPN